MVNDADSSGHSHDRDLETWSHVEERLGGQKMEKEWSEATKRGSGPDLLGISRDAERAQTRNLLMSLLQLFGPGQRRGN